jgi:hypothetical protein
MRFVFRAEPDPPRKGWQIVHYVGDDRLVGEERFHEEADAKAWASRLNVMASPRFSTVSGFLRHAAIAGNGTVARPGQSPSSPARNPTRPDGRSTGRRGITSIPRSRFDQSKWPSRL